MTYTCSYTHIHTHITLVVYYDDRVIFPHIYFLHYYLATLFLRVYSDGMNETGIEKEKERNKEKRENYNHAARVNRIQCARAIAWVLVKGV